VGLKIITSPQKNVALDIQCDWSLTYRQDYLYHVRHFTCDWVYKHPFLIAFSLEGR